jgi:hypothetical protein
VRLETDFGWIAPVVDTVFRKFIIRCLLYSPVTRSSIMKTLNWILIAVLCVFCIGIQIGYVVYNDAYPKEYKKVEKRYKQVIKIRLQGSDLAFFNGLNESRREVYLSSPDIQKRLLGNTIKMLIKDN